MVAIGEFTDEEQVQIIMYVIGVDEITARFILAIEKGEIDGDVVELKEET